MSDINWSEDQQKVIELRNRNILVSAAAGSGKTAVLVERIIQMITDEDYPVDIDKLLVVTFTKAAAAEMKGRVSKKLEENLSKNPESEHLQRQLSLLHNAQITTIDSFCQYIIRNYFHVIDLDPVFRVADTNELSLMKQEILQDVLEEKYTIAQNLEEETSKESKSYSEQEKKLFLKFTDYFSLSRTDEGINELILKLYDISTSYPWPEKWLDQCAKVYQCETIEEMEQEEWMVAFCSFIKEMIKDYVAMAKEARKICLMPDGPDQYIEMIESDIVQLETVESARNFKQLYDAVNSVEIVNLSRKKGTDVNADKKEAVKNLRELYMKDKGFKTLAKNYFFTTPEKCLENIKTVSPLVRQLIMVTKDFAKAYAKKKEEEGIIDFNDMEHFALQILVEEKEDGTVVPSAIAKELQEHYVEILTDEYQDSNYVQEMILTSLVRAPKEQPYLFMVGDVKQSIYQFRLARPQLFMEKYEKYTTDDSKSQKIDLQQNFRSRASVLESANIIFRKLMKKELGGIVYDKAAELVPGAKFEECEYDVGGVTELLLADTESVPENQEAIDKKQLEAAMIGRRIWDLMHQEKPYYIKDGDEYRPVEYRDMVILLRSQAEFTEIFVETLTDMGIPVYADTKTGYFTALEIETVLNFLKIIDNPRQDICLAAVLRSCIVGLSDEELAALALLPRKVNYWDGVQVCLNMQDKDSEEFKKNRSKLPLSDEEVMVLVQKITAFSKLLSYYQDMAQTASVYELLNSIYKKTGYYDIMTAMPAGERRAANLDILLQYAIEFAEYGYAGVFSFSRYIETLRKANVDYGEASVMGENMNAVRIMSVHKSKGLEFPVVFVSGLGKKINLMDLKKATILDSDYGVGADCVDLQRRTKIPTIIKKFMSLHIKENTLAEEIRILYVALTRAKEKLILTGVIKNQDKTFPKWQQKRGELRYSDLISAQTYLDWLGPIILPEAEEDGMFSVSVLGQGDVIDLEIGKHREELERKKKLQELDLTTSYDKEMEEAVKKQREFQYQYSEENKLPIKISVTEYKKMQLEQMNLLSEEEDTFLLPKKREKKAETVSEEVSEELEQEVEDIPRPSFMVEKQESAMARGTLYHMVMEHLPYDKIGEKDMLSDYLQKLVDNHYMTEKERKFINVKNLTKFLTSSLGKRMKDAEKNGTLKREQPFVFAVPAKELYDTESEEDILVQGIIDACFEEEGNIILVDYKTDFVTTEEELKKRYAVQLNLYAGALEQITGKKVIEKYIYSFCLGKEILV